MGLRDDILSQPVSALPVREVSVIDKGCTVRDAMTLMREKRIGCVYLVDENRRPTGSFTERLLVRLLASDKGQIDDPVDRHAIEVRCLVKLSDPITTVIRQMAHSEIRFACVVDEAGKIVGLTGQRGLMEYIADHFSRQIKVQSMDSKMHMDQREGA